MIESLYEFLHAFSVILIASHFVVLNYSISLDFLDWPHRHCVRVNPSMANRMVDSARSVLNKYLPDVYIYTDVVKGKEGGK